MSFNESQNKAVDHYKGPLLVLAGPGSGKTTVITHRTKKLIEEYKVDPSNILVVTFTKAAAMEMEQRFREITGQQKYFVSFGTFHSIFFRILKFAYNYNSNNILREEKKYFIMKAIIEDMEIEIEDISEFISGILSEISYVKSEMMNIDHYYSKNCGEEVFKEIFERYNKELVKLNVIDFDDMLLMCYELLSKRKDILKLWQNKYRFILVDEFQDINKVQYEVIKLLAEPENNIFVVGDDDQSIYGFRGAKPEIMLNFKKIYKDAKEIILNVNYRSTENIIKAADRLIINNKKRFNKKIRPEKGNGNNIEINEFKNSFVQSEEVIKIINDHIKNGGEYRDFAILYRTNTNPRILVQKLMEYNIPFKMKDAVPNIYEHFISKNIIAYIKISLGEYKRSNFLEIINRPKRYINREAFNTTEVSLEQIKRSYADKKYIIEKIEKLEYDLKLLSEMNPYSAINYIRHGIGYEDYINEYSEYRRIRPEEFYEVLDELTETSKPFNDYEEWFQHMEEYKEELIRQAAERYENSQCVELSTMHSSKGLEYKNVIIIDANEEITPHKKAVLNEDIEEERRMFYVAMTRAKERLFIFHCKERFGKELGPSRFVKEIIVNDTDKKGKEIIHTKYGRGIIIKEDKNKITVRFLKDGKEIMFDKEIVLTKGIIKIV